MIPKYDSIWHNPFKIGPKPQKDGDRDEVLMKYEMYIKSKLDNNMLELLRTLKGKNLGCWCAPEPCHGHILLKIIAEYGL